MNYSDIIQALESASAFDLYRLQTALDNMIDDPKRMMEVKKTLRQGMEIEFYDAAANRIEPAIVEKIMVLTIPTCMGLSVVKTLVHMRAGTHECYNFAGVFLSRHSARFIG